MTKGSQVKGHRIRQYQVIGRKVPVLIDPKTNEPTTNPEQIDPQIFRMKLFATSPVSAKSRFWYFMHQYHKMKKTTGEILSVNEIVEKNAGNVKNYCVWLRYYSRSGCHNMYKEVRDTHLNGAIEKLYLEMAGKHRARTSSIQIIKTGVVNCLKDSDGQKDVAGKTVRRDLTKAMLDSKIKFPMSHIIQRPALAKYKSTFIAKRPSTIFG